MWIFLLLASVLVALLTTLFLSRVRGRFYIGDVPNSRSLHAVPVSRAGGIGIMAGLLVAVLPGLLTANESRLLYPAVGILLVFTISLLDDLHGLPAPIRLPFHLAAAVLCLYPFVPGESSLLVWLAFVLCMVWMINLFNFMDGMDGLAASMAITGFGGLATLGWINQDNETLYLNLAVSLSVGGFLVFNLPRARIFMGDSGSCTLGLLAAAGSSWGVSKGLFQWPVPLLLFSPFIIDASYTLVRRALSGKTLWQAHREHIYQRLVLAGWPVWKILRYFWLLAVSVGVTALVVSDKAISVQWAALAAWMLVYAVILVRLERWLPPPETHRVTT